MAIAPRRRPGVSPPWQKLKPGPAGADAARIGTDATLVWADATGLQDLVRQGQTLPERWPVILELANDAAVRRFADELRRENGGTVAPAHRRATRSAPRFCTADLTPAYLAKVHAGACGGMIERLELHMPVIPRRARPLEEPALPEAAPVRRRRAGEVLVGVIDSGCAFAHHSIRRSDGGTRVLAWWDQDASPKLGGTIGGSQPADFGYGIELQRAHLDKLIRRFRRGASVNEQGCYDHCGHPALVHRASHGAAVLDLAAGRVPLSSRIVNVPERPPSWAEADDAAAEADIVFVDLPRDGVQDSSSGGLGRWLVDGLRYIVGFAGPKTKRIVINVSNGTSRTAHDGTSLLERAMLALVKEVSRPERSLHIVVAAGNDHDEERHAQVGPLPGLRRPARMKLFVPPGSEASHSVTVRLPVDRPSIEVRLVPPEGGPASPWIRAGQAVAWHPEGGSRANAAVVYPRPRPGEAATALIVVDSTDHAASAGGAPAGIWSLWVRARSPADRHGTVHAYVGRNQRNPGGLQRGRQAWFIDRFEDYDPGRWRREAEADPDLPRSPIRREGTLNGLATAEPGLGVVVVGSISLREGRPARYSSAGPAAGGVRQGPDAAAVTDMHRNLRGILCAGTTSGTFVRMLGTSFAAPQIARYIAQTGTLPPRNEARSRVAAEPDRLLRTGGREGYWKPPARPHERVTNVPAAGAATPGPGPRAGGNRPR